MEEDCRGPNSKEDRSKENPTQTVSLDDANNLFLGFKNTNVFPYAVTLQASWNIWQTSSLDHSQTTQL